MGLCEEPNVDIIHHSKQYPKHSIPQSDIRSHLYKVPCAVKTIPHQDPFCELDFPKEPSL